MPQIGEEYLMRVDAEEATCRCSTAKSSHLGSESKDSLVWLSLPKIGTGIFLEGVPWEGGTYSRSTLKEENERSLVWLDWPTSFPRRRIAKI